MSEDKGIKVTDKRMFTADGELREDFRDLGGDDRAGAEPAAAGAEAPPPREAERPAPALGPEPAPEGAAAERPPLEIPGAPPGAGALGFAELLSVLAEPIAIYLGEARLPEGESMENLEAARFYIDLLDVLRAKTAGNLTAQEAKMLEDLLYRFRLRYVQKRG